MILGTFSRWSLTAPVALLTALMHASAADVSFFGVVKSGVYTQAVGVAPAPFGTNAFQFISFAIGTGPATLSNATVRIPSGATRQMATNVSEGLISLLTSGNDTVWLFSEEFPTSAAMDAVYPSVSGLLPSLSSRYTVNMYTVHDGVQSHELSYYLGGVPPVPNIANLTNAQVIDAHTDFTLRWSSLAGSLIPRIVYLSILDRSNQVVLTSPAPFTEGALDGNSTSYVIPAETLNPGQSYLGTLMVFQPALPNTNYATGVIGHLRSTTFPLLTLPPPRPAPARLAETRLDGDQFVFEIHVQPDQRYELQMSENLIQWTTVQTIVWPMAVYLHRQPDAAGVRQRFFRVIAP